MRYETVLGATAKSPPFLTVVTRCYKRPTFLEKNKASLAMQTMTDYEQKLIIDETGHGLHAANKALATVSPLGEYVLCLDDDDMLLCPEAIETLKQYADENERPALIFFKADHDILGTLPEPAVWGKRPIHGMVGSCDFITRRDVWEEHIEAFGTPESGDYHYLKSIWKEAPSVAWLDKKLAAVQRISGGKAE